MKIKFILFSIFLIYANSSIAQKSNELLLQLINNKKATQINKFDYLCELSLKLSKKDSLQAYKYANQALKIGVNLNSKIKQVIAFENLSKLSSMYNDLQNQIKYADK